MSFLFRKRSNNNQSPSSSSQDEEVDGFVLIGQTNDEKNTVKPKDAVNHETPPSYMALQQQETSEGISHPNQHASTVCKPSISSTKEKPVNSTYEHLSSKDNRTAVKDIPFQFASSIETSLRHENLMEGFIMPALWCDTNVEYSFEMEHSVLSD